MVLNNWLEKFYHCNCVLAITIVSVATLLHVNRSILAFFKPEPNMLKILPIFFPAEKYGLDAYFVLTIVYINVSDAYSMHGYSQ